MCSWFSLISSVSQLCVICLGGGVALSPRIGLWSLGGLCSWLRMVGFWPMRLSVILLPQSRVFDDGVLYLGVLCGVVVSY